jgi:hypothetical protein
MPYPFLYIDLKFVKVYNMAESIDFSLSLALTASLSRTVR